MFSKILIANRGEIACRVIKTANKLGIKTVAVYSDADSNALHVTMADEAIHIGAAPSSASYLVGEKIIQAALKTGAEAIHPGYGFLSENAEFAQLCADNDLVFIGPPIEAIKSMGSKSAAKKIMSKAKVPLVPGYHGDDQDPELQKELLKKSANDMGYPVLLKAVAGGGGKGMRQVWSEDEFGQELIAAKSEAKSSFGNDDMLVEKYLTQPRHVEVQVFCDQHGNGVYLFERDCSVQRRHQKIIEEAPAPNMLEGLREEMGETAVRAAQAINYQGAGTVEFLLDSDGSYYFMEMNTRLQVEHPVTEMITGQDLVEWQLCVANGETLPLKQKELSINGHSFEARIYAEDPFNDFMPTSGNLQHVQLPKAGTHCRIDTGVIEGDEVSPYYDPMISKLIVWDENRDRALTRMSAALAEYQIAGITTNIQFLTNLTQCQAFIDAELDTGFIEKNKDVLFKQTEINVESTLLLASLYLYFQRVQNDELANSPWNAVNNWRLNQSNSYRNSIQINEQTHEVSVEVIDSKELTTLAVSINDETFTIKGNLNNKQLTALIDGHKQNVTIAPIENKFVIFSPSGSIEFSRTETDLGESETEQSGDFKAPMNGTIVEVLVKSGASVAKGDTLVVMEAMKMQHAIQAPSDGLVSELFCAVGELVDGGSELLKFEAA